MKRLRIAGPLLVADAPVRLRGVNLSGLEYSRGAITPALLDEVKAWGTSFVRVPFNQSWVLDDDTYCDELSQAAALASERGMYLLFDLQWLAHGQRRGTNPDGSNIATPPLPDRDSPRAWRKLATRFGEDPAVMFDLLNEPHDRCPDDRFPLHAPDGSVVESGVVTHDLWHAWVRHLYDEIRPFAPETLVFVSGIGWAFDCAPLELEVVHAPHVYPHEGRRTRADWQRGFGRLNRPVVVTELGPLDDDLAPVAALLDFLDERNLGWAAWSWRDQPRLVGEDGAPTAFGQLIRARLQDASQPAVLIK